VRPASLELGRRFVEIHSRRRIQDQLEREAQYPIPGH
jgi:hypothetical protein